MSYSIHNYKEGDMLHPEDLNEMDAAISANDEEISKVNKNLGIFQIELEIENGGIDTSYGADKDTDTNKLYYARTKNYIPVKVGEKIYFDGVKDNTALISRIYIYCYDSNYDFIKAYNNPPSPFIPPEIFIKDSSSEESESEDEEESSKKTFYIRIQFNNAKKDGNLDFIENFRIYRKSGTIFEDISSIEIQNNSLQKKIPSIKFACLEVS